MPGVMGDKWPSLRTLCCKNGSSQHLVASAYLCVRESAPDQADLEVLGLRNRFLPKMQQCVQVQHSAMEESRGVLKDTVNI